MSFRRQTWLQKTDGRRGADELYIYIYSLLDTDRDARQTDRHTDIQNEREARPNDTQITQDIMVLQLRIEADGRLGLLRLTSL